MVIDIRTWWAALVLLFCRVERRDGNQLLRLQAAPHTPLVTSADLLPSTESGAGTPMGAGEF